MKLCRRKPPERFKTLPNGYRFDRWLFRALAACFVAIALLTVWFYGIEDNVYFVCPEDTRGYCQNPFINTVGECIVTDTFLCGADAFAPGFRYGNKPAWIITNYGMLFVTLAVLTFLMNHFRHNPRFAR